MLKPRFYRMLDLATATNKPCLETAYQDCKVWNEKGYGIFWTLNEFSGNRIKANLTKINAWAIDMDEGTKAEQLARISAGLVPSYVVETKRGYQVYFMAEDAEERYFKHIMLDRLIPFYRGDKKAADVSRVLRVPGFYHCKDPADKFLVQKVWERKSLYTQKTICAFYPDVNEGKKEEFVERSHAEARTLNQDASIWERIYHMDHMEALARLSGAPEVNGEVFTFKPVSRNRHNIYVNGQSTSCFIDEFNRIGSSDGGGPCVTQWLHWYLKDWRAVMQTMRAYFPELFHQERSHVA